MQDRSILKRVNLATQGVKSEKYPKLNILSCHGDLFKHCDVNIAAEIQEIIHQVSVFIWGFNKVNKDDI